MDVARCEAAVGVGELELDRVGLVNVVVACCVVYLEADVGRQGRRERIADDRRG